MQVVEKMILNGYHGTILNVDLSRRGMVTETPDTALLRRHLGGVSLGARLLYDLSPPRVGWDDPENPVILLSGLLGGTQVMGSGTICLCTRGAMTGGATSTQANGFLGAYLRHAGYDGLVIRGRAESLSYLHITDAGAQIRDAAHLAGRDTWQTEAALRAELGGGQMSVFCIGPAGEHRVRFAALVGDSGHVAAHNGPGAVLGAKNLKAIVVARGKQAIPQYDRPALKRASERMFAIIKEDSNWSNNYHYGTLWLMPRNAPIGRAPFKNYTTNVCPMTPAELSTFTPEHLRGTLPDIKPHPCWACRMHHCHLITLPEGPHAGEPGEEPEYEGLAGMGTQLGVHDGITATALSNEVDRFGMDVNETGWALGLTIECYQAGLISSADTGGLEMTWGNVSAIREMTRRIAFREGFGDVLADGAMRAAAQIGGDAPSRAVHGMGGNTPLSHDHRRYWPYLFDVSVSDGGSSDLHVFPRPERFAVADFTSPFAAAEVVDYVLRVRGVSPFIDSLGVCRQPNREVMEILTEMIYAATGWQFTTGEALDVGLRALNLMRAFNLRAGVPAEAYAPSPRYGSAPPDGDAAGHAIHPDFVGMRQRYYAGMGWHPADGRPLPETLRGLGLEDLVADLWPDGEPV